VDTGKDPWAAFGGLANRTVVLTVSEEPKVTDKARYVLVKLGADDYGIRFRAWIEKNRRYVSEKTNGRVGYIYVPDTSIPGQNELVRQFYGQLDREALIIDERWNGGGQVPTRFVELLNRPIANYWALRDRDEDFPWPPDAHHGPKCMLINGLAGSGGDYFPFWFRAAGVGKLIGRRTWGGLVGISGNPPLIDGGYTSSPTFAFFEKDGTWGIEGHGVDPDIEVVDDPAKMVGGKDPQLDAAIDHMLDELERNPYRPPKRPRYPDRSGMGIKNEDK
jgi:tricorn protease